MQLSLPFTIRMAHYVTSNFQQGSVNTSVRLIFSTDVLQSRNLFTFCFRGVSNYGQGSNINEKLIVGLSLFAGSLWSNTGVKG